MVNPEEIVSKLEAIYGRNRKIARFDALEELVCCMMSQHTADANSFPAFTRLLETYPTWQAVVDSGPEHLAETIRKAGLANQKSRSIIACLTQIKTLNGDFTLEPLRTMNTDDAMAWLMGLPGVGPKTASIVLCFNFDRGTIPVDTHVYRVSWRLGLFGESIGEAKAHAALRKLVPERLAYRFHSSLIQHGRLMCRAPLPDCTPCPLKELCEWFAAGGPEHRRAELASKRSQNKLKSRS